MSDAVIVALIGLVGVLATVVLGYTKLQRELGQAKLEMRFQRAALSFPEFVEEWHEISHDILLLMSETVVDRFLVLRAWNGHMEPRWTTALFQLRTDGQMPVAYVHFELDTDYVNRLREVTQKNNVYLVTKDLPPDSALAEVYRSEGVTASLVSHLASQQGPNPNAKAHTYCTFATHNEALMDENTRTRCKVLASRMKGFATSFDNNPI
jgi:hypothetical protein